MELTFRQKKLGKDPIRIILERTETHMNILKIEKKREKNNNTKRTTSSLSLSLSLSL
jgi:hypothetical protein